MRTDITIGLIWLIVLSTLSLSCQREGRSVDLASSEPGSEITVYKLYHQRILQPQDELKFQEQFDMFRKFYEDHGVQVFGYWQNVNDPLDTYFMTGFRDAFHYRDFVTAMKSNLEYIENTLVIEENRESIDIITLKSVVEL